MIAPGLEAETMEDLFRSYWWLLFPLAWFVVAGWHSWLNYQKHRDTMDMIKRYADSGKEPPAGLLDKLNAGTVDDGWGGYDDRRSRRYYYRRGMGGWPNVVLFGALAAGFGYASYTDIYGAGEAFTIVAFVMAAVCLASLVRTLITPPPRD
jgi:hypothetical protein